MTSLTIFGLTKSSYLAQRPTKRARCSMMFGDWTCSNKNVIGAWSLFNRKMSMVYFVFVFSLSIFFFGLVVAYSAKGMRVRSHWPNGRELVRKLNLWLIKQRLSIHRKKTNVKKERKKNKNKKKHFKFVLIDQCALCVFVEYVVNPNVCPSSSMLHSDCSYNYYLSLWNRHPTNFL